MCVAFGSGSFVLCCHLLSCPLNVDVPRFFVCLSPTATAAFLSFFILSFFHHFHSHSVIAPAEKKKKNFSFTFYFFFFCFSFLLFLASSPFLSSFSVSSLLFVSYLSYFSPLACVSSLQYKQYKQYKTVQNSTTWYIIVQLTIPY